MGLFLSTVVLGLLAAVVIGVLVGILARRVHDDQKTWIAPLTAGVVTAAGVAAIGLWAASRVGLAGPGTPACNGVTDPTQPDQRAAALSCGSTTLTFEGSPHGNADIQFLDILDTLTNRAAPGGPLAAILPESNAHRNTAADLAEGRMVGRIWVDTLSEGYPKLGLAPGINYVWIDANNPPQGEVHRGVAAGPATPAHGFAVASQRGETATRGRFRAVIIPENPQFPVQVRPVDFFDHTDEEGYRGYNQPLARWIYWPDDVGAWFNCTRHGCCSVDR